MYKFFRRQVLPPPLRKVFFQTFFYCLREDSEELDTWKSPSVYGLGRGDFMRKFAWRAGFRDFRHTCCLLGVPENNFS